MNQYKIIAPQDIHTEINLPSSKSICNRALIINALANSSEEVNNLSDCDDTSVMIKALREMPYTIDIMAAGTAMRFLTSYLAVTPGEHIITGTQRMQQRPIRILVDALRLLGADISYTLNEGFPPLLIRGKKLEGKSISLPGDISSQYISSLLMIAPVLKNGLILTLEGDIISRPYIDMTLRLMNDFGANARWTSTQEIIVDAKPYQPVPYLAESDWSAASYWYEIATLTPNAHIVLPGLFHDSCQGDSRVKDLFCQLGIDTSFHDNKVILSKSGHKVPTMEYDFVNQPDLAQTFAVTCCMTNVHFRFTGLHSLRIKETDRIYALITEMRKLGYIIRTNDNDELIWAGERTEADTHPVIQTYEDHRMAMAFAPAAACIEDMRIAHPEVVSKSYPQYWKHLLHSGFTITEE